MIVMLQAWPEKPVRNYADHWDDGHWVVAIGYDADAVYFEDPSCHSSRAFLTRAEFMVRWHDYDGRKAKKNRRQRYGIVVRGPRSSRFAFRQSARHID